MIFLFCTPTYRQVRPRFALLCGIASVLLRPTVGKESKIPLPAPHWPFSLRSITVTKTTSPTFSEKEHHALLAELRESGSKKRNGGGPASRSSQGPSRTEQKLPCHYQTPAVSYPTALVHEDEETFPNQCMGLSVFCLPTWILDMAIGAWRERTSKHGTSASGLIASRAHAPATGVFIMHHVPESFGLLEEGFGYPQRDACRQAEANLSTMPLLIGSLTLNQAPKWRSRRRRRDFDDGISLKRSEGSGRSNVKSRHYTAHYRA
ncbi:uncharacterized protein UV8b_02380 [Ustilaginoidea virens]|uniref:Uncharacterized protein n=1 Tax=Ustilaginoidea virens TaxID=1159556 RepID=A0A8E5HMD6_USTVR|nr:uncharacterized protein UV8b_02380 [Ustilaginoidea virens]QUC18139.1 hypothetical protein UV8b_02380 [Ustilaginoidea virens]